MGYKVVVVECEHDLPHETLERGIELAKKGITRIIHDADDYIIVTNLPDSFDLDSKDLGFIRFVHENDKYEDGKFESVTGKVEMTIMPYNSIWRWA